MAATPETEAALEGFGETKPTEAVRGKLFAVSASTAGRMPAPERRRVGAKSRSKTKRGLLPKRRIPVRTFSERDENRAGFLEADPVGHDGGCPKGTTAKPWTRRTKKAGGRSRGRSRTRRGSGPTRP